MTRLRSLREVADATGLRIAHVRSLAREGVLPLVRLGRRCFVDERAFDELIANGGRGFKAGWRKAPGGTPGPRPTNAGAGKSKSPRGKSESRSRTR
jgi:hypothetical protein